MVLHEIINRNAVVIHSQATCKNEVIEELAVKLFQDGSISDIEAFVQDVYQRENEGITGIGKGIAIPHGKSVFVDKTCIAIAKLENPIKWESIDEEPVRVVFLFAVDDRDRSTYFIKLMSKVARLLACDTFCLNLLNAENEEELMRLFI